MIDARTNPSEILGDYFDIKLVRHETPESIFDAHWNFENDPSLSFEELLDSIIGGDVNGEEIYEECVSLRSVFETMKEAGFWAFSKTRQNEIHFWMDVHRALEFEALLVVLGHELGHVLKESSLPPVYCQEEFEEIEADRFGIAAALAFRMAQQILREMSESWRLEKNETRSAN